MDKPTSVQDFFATRMYNNHSPEQRTKEEGIAQWIGRTGVPARIVEDDRHHRHDGKNGQRVPSAKKTCYFKID
jgi:hypothetical protein